MNTGNYTAIYNSDVLHITVSGEIDHHTAHNLRDEIDKNIYLFQAKTVIMDLSNVEFMDSAGLGLILGRYSKVSALGGKLKIVNPTDNINKLLELAGTGKIIQIERYNKNEKHDSQ